MPHDSDLEAALEAARRAGRLILAAYESFVAIPDARADITTEVDRQSQETILQYLCQRFPADALCAEEATPTLAAAAHSGSRMWVVDPIDGTRGFAQKNGEFSVMIALLVEGRITVGVVLEPASHRLTYAERGGGCWRQDGDAGTDGLPRHDHARAERGHANAEPLTKGWRAVAVGPSSAAEANPRNLLGGDQVGAGRARRGGLLRQFLRGVP